MTSIDISAVENEINNIYRWFAREAPGVPVREEGHLAELWAYVDRNIVVD